MPAPSRLQHRAGADAEPATRLRARDAVGREPVPALPALQSVLRRPTEHAIGRDPERALERAHTAAATAVPRPSRAMVTARALLLQSRTAAEAERLASPPTSDAVGRQAVPLLPPLERLRGRRSEVAVAARARRPRQSRQQPSAPV
jgi:hypothetical protein